MEVAAEGGIREPAACSHIPEPEGPDARAQLLLKRMHAGCVRAASLMKNLTPLLQCTCRSRVAVQTVAPQAGSYHAMGMQIRRVPRQNPHAWVNDGGVTASGLLMDMYFLSPSAHLRNYLSFRLGERQGICPPHALLCSKQGRHVGLVCPERAAKRTPQCVLFGNNPPGLVQGAASRERASIKHRSDQLHAERRQILYRVQRNAFIHNAYRDYEKVQCSEFRVAKKPCVVQV